MRTDLYHAGDKVKISPDSYFYYDNPSSGISYGQLPVGVVGEIRTIGKNEDGDSFYLVTWKIGDETYSNHYWDSDLVRVGKRKDERDKIL